jgi:hypothetical protein
MIADRTASLAIFTGSLTLAGVGLALLARQDAVRRRGMAEIDAAAREARREMRAAALDSRLTRLETLAAAQRQER